jgi:hypothetical protein
MTKPRAAAKNITLPSSTPLLQPEQMSSAAPSDSSSLLSQPSLCVAESQRCEVSATAAGPAAAPSLLLVAAAQKLLQEQQRADSLLKANLEADSQIASLRACVLDKEQQLQHLGQALAAASAISTVHAAQPVVAALPTSSSASMPLKEPYMPEVEQRLWEEQQRSLR